MLCFARFCSPKLRLLAAVFYLWGDDLMGGALCSKSCTRARDAPARWSTRQDKCTESPRVRCLKVPKLRPTCMHAISLPFLVIADCCESITKHVCTERASSGLVYPCSACILQRNLCLHHTTDSFVPRYQRHGKYKLPHASMRIVISSGDDWRPVYAFEPSFASPT
jgi:hypothetical protein